MIFPHIRPIQWGNNFAFFLLMSLLLPRILLASSLSPVALHGNLQVQDGVLVDQSGKSIQLRGMSSFWLNWMGKFANPSSIAWLQNDWKINVFRAAVGIEEAGGYLEKPEATLQKVDEIITTCEKLGLYVIVDFHSHHADQHAETAKTFFRQIAKKYGHLPNLIYEPWNEPLKVSWKDTVRPYFESIVPVIREEDPDNVILLGTPHWAQKVDQAAEQPLPGKNLMYTLHFYSGSHEMDLRDKAEASRKKGLPIFVSEFGVSDALGGGNEDRKVYLKEAEKWLDWMNQHQISWINWSLCDKDESSAALRPGVSPNGEWSEADLTESGNFIREQLRNHKNPHP
jgi:endoglucanase